MAAEVLYQWQILEYEHRPRSSDWTWIVGIVGVALSIVAVIMGNLLFGVFILVATFTLVLFAHKHPDVMDVEITTRGVRVNKEYFPYTKLRSYWVDDEDEDREAVLILSSKERTMLPNVKIPIHPDIDPDELKEIMLDFLDEEYQEPSLIEEIGYRLGI